MGGERTLRLPLASVARRRTAVFRAHQQIVRAGANTLVLQLSPRSLASQDRLLVPPVRPPLAAPPPRVAYTRTGASSYRFIYRSRVPGVLVIDRSYDPRWQLHAEGRTLSPVSTFGLVNGYLLPAGDYKGSISFS